MVVKAIKAPKLSVGPVSLARQDTIDEGGKGDTALNRDRKVTLIEREQRPSLERQITDRLLNI
jgi:hypothetical protein